MLGSNAGSVIGSVRESLGKKHKDFPLFVPGCRFTDDLLQASAGAEWLLHGGDSTIRFMQKLWHDRRFCQLCPMLGSLASSNPQGICECNIVSVYRQGVPIQVELCETRAGTQRRLGLKMWPIGVFLNPPR